MHLRVLHLLCLTFVLKKGFFLGQNKQIGVFVRERAVFSDKKWQRKVMKDSKLFCHFLFIELPRFNKVLQNLSDESKKWAYLFQNLSRLKNIPVEFDENYFTDLFLIANFTLDEKEKYTEDEKMIYDY